MSDLLFLLVAVSGIGAVALGGVLAVQAAELKRARTRLARIGSEAKRHKPGITPVTVRRNMSDSSVKALDTLIKRYLPQPAKLRDRLAATGARVSVGEYVLISLIVGMGVFLVLANVAHLGMAIAAPLAVAASAGVPYVFTGWLIGRRQRKFLVQFADGVDLIVRGLKSGIPVNESIHLVGKEIPDPVGFEFRQVMDSMTLGQSLTESFASASKRVNLPEFRFFVISLSIQQETGGNLAETLENLATIVRQRKQMKLKVRAISSEARASAYILGSLPFIMCAGLSALDPDYMGILYDGTKGHIVLGAALASIATGIGIMMKMAKFDI